MFLGGVEVACVEVGEDDETLYFLQVGDDGTHCFLLIGDDLDSDCFELFGEFCELLLGDIFLAK